LLDRRGGHRQWAPPLVNACRRSWRRLTRAGSIRISTPNIIITGTGLVVAITTTII
jgi:hypothetical protein